MWSFLNYIPITGECKQRFPSPPIVFVTMLEGWIGLVANNSNNALTSVAESWRKVKDVCIDNNEVACIYFHFGQRLQRHVTLIEFKDSRTVGPVQKEKYDRENDIKNASQKALQFATHSSNLMLHVFT